MKMKKWMLGLITFAAMVVICAVCAGAERYGDFEYNISEDGTVEIIGYNGSAANVNIPAKINGKPVKYISENSFHNITTLKSVKIPDGVTFIGYNAFEGCTSLSVVTIPDSVTAICGDAFKNTAILAKQTTPVKYVGNWAVQSDKNSKSVTLKAGTVGVANETFEACSALTKVTLSPSIRYIGNMAFFECASLTSISIPEGVTEIPYEAFGNCTSLKNVTLPKTLKTIGDLAFSQCTSLQNISIPDSVIEVGEAAFFDTAIIKKQKTDVKYVDKWAVDCDESAESVTLKSDTVGIANNAFQGCGLSSVSIPKSVANIGIFAFESCGLEDIVIPTKVKEIKYATFANCNSLKTVTMPNNVEEIGSDAFTCCNRLENIVLSKKLKEIGMDAFNGCVSLKSMEIPASVTTISLDKTFSSCDGLSAIKVANANKNFCSVDGVLYNKNKTELICYPAGKTDKTFNIPDNVTTIGNGAFESNAYLTNVTIPSNITEISDNAFCSCTSLANVTISKGVKKIGSGAFDRCYSLKKITIPDGVTTIGDLAFSWCHSLASVNIPDSVTSVGSGAFSMTTISDNQETSVKYLDKWIIDRDYSIDKVDIKQGVVGIASEVFSFSGIKSISLPDSIKYIGEGAFEGCLLTDIKMPTGIIDIGERAFANCSEISNIVFPSNVKNIGNSAFYDCTSLKSVTIPRNVKSIGNMAFGYYYHGYANSANSGNKKLNGFKIKCYTNTAGEKYAEDNWFSYTLLDPKPSAIKGAKLGGRAADALRVNWSKNASADGYIVEMYQNGKWTRVAKITNNSTTTFRKAGLKAGTVYKFRVKAYKMSGKTAAYGAYSATVAARTNPSVIAGAKLGGRAADALRINWTKNASADGYIVEMYQGNKWVRVAKITSNSTTTFRKAGLKASTVYKFRVKAYKMSGKTALYGNYSATVTARTNPSIVKGGKIGGKAKDALRVNWAKNSSAQGYIVEMYKGGKWVRVAKITNNSTTTFRKAGLAKNTTYKFRLKAYYMSGKTALYGGYGSVSGKTLAK